MVKPLTIVNCAATAVLPAVITRRAAAMHSSPAILYSFDGRRIAEMHSANDMAAMVLPRGIYMLYRKGVGVERIMRLEK